MIAKNPLQIALVLVALCSGIASNYTVASTIQRIDDFALLDQHGRFHQLTYYKDRRAIALFVYSSASSDQTVQSFIELAEAKDHQSYQFFLLHSSAVEEAAAQGQNAHAEIPLPVLNDDHGLIANLLSLTYADEVLLIDPATLKLFYRGPMGPSVNKAFEQIADGQTPDPGLTPMPASALRLPELKKVQQSTVSYNRDIAPLLIDRCVTCHREGGVAPFAMDSWGVVLGWSPMIKEVLLTKRMPPGQIDPAVGKFKNSGLLTESELQKILWWIENGSPNDGEPDPLAEFEWTQAEWAFGEPDLIIDLPTQTIPATGLIDYVNLHVAAPLNTDVWLRASQFVPGDRRVLHHGEAYISVNENTKPAAITAEFLAQYYRQSDADVAHIAPFVPGVLPEPMPDNTGGLIRQGSSLLVQLHYAAIGREVKDSSRLGLWFYEDGKVPAQRMAITCVCVDAKDWKAIPAYQAEHTVRASYTIKKDAYLHSILPQMHYRGSAIRFVAHYSDGTQEHLLNVPRYNYNWQINYYFNEPKFVPADTKIEVIGVYDNSNNNAFNPDPSQDVPWGLESYNEILAGVLQLKYAEQ